jgi:hypothetical protein
LLLSKVTAAGAEITKLVDREEFSRANFGTGKPTTKEDQEDKGVIFIGKKERDGITAEQSKQIWEIYAKYLNKPIEVIISDVTPVKSVYDYADNNKDVNIIVGAGDKDDDVKRYEYFEKNIEKYPLVRVVKIPMQAEGISGTMTRELINSDINKAIEYFTPDVLSTEDKANIKQILN